VLEGAVELRPGASQRPLHAVLVGKLELDASLLTRLESGVTVPRDQQGEAVRELYVATRRQVKALSATLELEGPE
jgi:hypothetical protein